MTAHLLTPDDIVAVGACMSGVRAWLVGLDAPPTAATADQALALAGEGTEAASFIRRACETHAELDGYGDGYGYGYGYGDGYGYGYGYGDGYGDGYGYGYGDGDGYGS